jgi:hypothetical protein
MRLVCGASSTGAVGRVLWEVASQRVWKWCVGMDVDGHSGFAEAEK